MGLSILLRSSCPVDLSVSCQGSCWHRVLSGQYPRWPVVLWLCGWSSLGCFSFPQSGPGLKVTGCSVERAPSMFVLLQRGVCNPTGAAVSQLGVWELCREGTDCVLQPWPWNTHVPGDLREEQWVAGHHTVPWPALSEQEQNHVFWMML